MTPTPEHYRLARLIVTALCQYCQGTGTLSEVDIGVGVMHEPCACTGDEMLPDVVMCAEVIARYEERTKAQGETP